MNKTSGEPILLREMASAMRTPPLRTIAEFAEQEIIIPTGPFAGRRFRLDRSPAARLWFKELDGGRWARAFATGPNQDGKSLIGFVIPTMYQLFERKETVVLGVPSLDIVADKLKVDLLPVIKASRYAKLLPTSGGGSREGDSVLFEFKDGQFLRFMTGGGGDQARASFTTPNLIVTETDGFDVVGGRSREGNKFDQLERRTLAFADQARVVAECTVSTETGRTWWEYTNGTKSRICIPCPHCGEYVTPERSHFVGWQEAETELQAIERAAIACPACGTQWTNEERIAANCAAVLAHNGQTVSKDGTVQGPLPQTNTLGFRWTVVNSLLNPRRLAMVGGIEWRAQRAADEDAAERDVCQSQWALPAKPAKVDLTQLDAFAIMRRITPKLTRGFCPLGTQCVTVGCDVGKWKCHWVAKAWRPHATPHVIDYGVIEVPSAQMQPEDAILLALRDWRDETVADGWKLVGAENVLIKPTFTFVDAGNEWKLTVARFCAESSALSPGYFPVKGFGLGQKRAGMQKRETGSRELGRGDNYAHILLPDGIQLVEINVDYWKSWLHTRLHTPIDRPGALTLFDPGPAGGNDHLSFSKHLTAEKQVEEFVPREGTVTRWEAVSRNNHYFDASTYACVAGHAAGMRSVEDATPQPKQGPAPEPNERPSWMPEKPTNWMNR